MLKKIFAIVLIAILFSISIKSVRAIYDPLSVPNNRFGIHIADISDIKAAADLVNSSGGDWGYVTFVITKNDKNTEKWQRIFDDMRRKHLIPIVRIATRFDGINWEKPSFGEIDGWVSFLNSLNWVVRNRYIVIANEPNHAKEWGGEINPEEYSRYLVDFSQKLKNASDEFYILPAGFDASASNSKETMEESLFLRKIAISNKDYFEAIDGWASHSYPNPAFSGSPDAFGKGTVRSYQWELSFLKGLGINKEYPVFITETGWTHNMNGSGKKLFSTDLIGTKLIKAYSNAWDDKKIVAVTPFVLNYLDAPFDIFSWKTKNGDFYSFYYDVQKIGKTQGEPIQESKGDILAAIIQPFHFARSSFSGVVVIKNLGQSIWNINDISIKDTVGARVLIFQDPLSEIEPNTVTTIKIEGAIPNEPGIQTGSLSLYYKDKQMGKTYTYQIFVITNLRMQLKTIFAKIAEILKFQ
jgi:hypothetical protein